MATLAPCVWIPGQAEEAAAFYLAAFQRAGQPAEIRGRMRMGAEGALIAVTVVLAGQEVILFNPRTRWRIPTPSRSSSPARRSGRSIALWDGLLEGGKPVQCGWLTDRYGVSWQVVPGPVADLLQRQTQPRPNG